MNNIELIDSDGNKIKGELLFTHYDATFNKNYIIYLIEKDLIASSYELVDNKYIINNDLSTKEYDMLDELIERKMKELDE